MWGVINRVVKENNIKITSPGMMVKIPKDKIKPAIKEFLATPLQDVDCFATTVAMVEALSDAEAVRVRAIAWATGDLAALRELPDLPDAQSQCQAALLSSQVIRDLASDGSDNLRERIEQLWLDAVETALASNKSTFAVLPIAELLNPSGRLSVLKAKGYLIVEPQQVD